MSCVTMEQMSTTEKEKTPARLWFEKNETSYTILALNSKSIVRLQKIEIVRQDKKTYLVFAS